MKAISLWQPWASAMALGWKQIETRHWQARYRGPMAIHAAKRWTADERDEWEIAVEIYGDRYALPVKPPLGCIVAVGNLHDIRPSEDLHGTIAPEEREWGNYGPNRFGWVFRDIRALAEPIPWRGEQGLFDIPDEVFAPGFLTECAPAAPPPPKALPLFDRLAP